MVTWLSVTAEYIDSIAQPPKDDVLPEMVELSMVNCTSYSQTPPPGELRAVLPETVEFRNLADAVAEEDATTRVVAHLVPGHGGRHDRSGAAPHVEPAAAAVGPRFRRPPSCSP